ncbi:MAG: DMT family transporter [Sebaldella sp.]|nr:DMT family transporter [Sebaldella sp.]
MIQIKKSYYADLLLLLVAIIWGTGFTASKIAVDSGVMPFMMMSLRFGIASIALLGLVLFKKCKITKKEVIAGVIIGIFLYAAFATQTIGIQYTTSSKNAFLTGTNVIFVPYLCWIIFRRKPDKFVFISTLLAFLGICLLSVDVNELGSFTMNKGDIYTLFCALFFALHIISLDYFTKTYDTIVLAFLQILFACIFSIISAVFSGQLTTTMSTNGLLATLYLGIFSTFLAFTIQTVAQKYTSSNKTVIILSTEAVFGAIFSIIVLHEHFSTKLLFGCILILAAILISETKLNFLYKYRRKTV